ncbi:hypothetical protein AB0I39_30535 [Kitasatospora purpeofusca]|uniref:hypothetical protein n=1 Tax=Kitasatospora purpeofusca TaxID=67352 RepID=UPI0033E46D4C
MSDTAGEFTQEQVREEAARLKGVSERRRVEGLNVAAAEAVESAAAQVSGQVCPEGARPSPFFVPCPMAASGSASAAS